MKLLRYMAVLIVVVAAPASAQLTTLVESVEASTDVVNVPTSPHGRLAFKPCAERCSENYITVRLNDGTQYFVQGQRVSFAEFRREFFNRRRSVEGYALVSYDTERDTATSVEVSF